MKILDRYILISFLKTFFSVFIIFLFIFILQGVWLYISELAGKDLDISVTLRFILYIIPRLIPTVVPLTILLTSIMVFGRFAENYEFAAMKSTGISLQRAMRNVSVFIVILGIGCFFFSNNVIPWGEFKFYNLRLNLKKTKPALAIVEGQFNEFGNMNIKVDKKSKRPGEEEENLLDKVVIHQRSGNKSKNNKVIIAEKGELKSSINSSTLQLLLINGNHYEEVHSKDRKKTNLKPHVNSNFKTYTFNIDLEALNSTDFDKEDSKGGFKMLDVSQLSYTIDSLKIQKKNSFETFATTLYNRSSYHTLNSNIPRVPNRVEKELKIDDSLLAEAKLIKDVVKADSIISKKTDSIYTGNLLDLFEIKKKSQILNLANTSANSTINAIKPQLKSLKTKNIWINKHIHALHSKYVLAISCIVLFFVGAPLGALIKKGGIGLPIVIAVLLFLTYFFLGIFAKNSAEKGSLNIYVGAWLSTLVMLPLSIYLTVRATNDKSAFEIDSFFEYLKRLFKIKKPEYTETSLAYSADAFQYKRLEELDTKILKSIVKTFRTLDYTIEDRNTAIVILNKRGLSTSELKLTGVIDDYQHIEKTRLKYRYQEISNLALILYCISAPLVASAPILTNNKYLEIGTTFYITGIFLFLIFITALVKSFNANYDLQKHLGNESNSVNAIIFFLVGLPLYFAYYIFESISEKNQSKPSKKNSLSGFKELPPSLVKTKSVLKDFIDYSNASLVNYSIGFVLFISHFILKNNKLEEVAQALLSLSIIALVMYLIYFIVDTWYYRKLCKLMNRQLKPIQLIWLLLLFPVYPIRYILLKNKALRDFYDVSISVAK